MAGHVSFVVKYMKIKFVFPQELMFFRGGHQGVGTVNPYVCHMGGVQEVFLNTFPHAKFTQLGQQQGGCGELAWGHICLELLAVPN